MLESGQFSWGEAMDPEKVLAIALRSLPANAWESKSISGYELLAAAAAALAAYAHPAEFELKDTRRAIVVPSDTFRQRVQTGQALAAGVLQGVDLPISFVETRYFVAAILKVRDFVLVGYRGTADGYDLFLDMNVRKREIPARSSIRPKVHRGFLRGFLEGFPHVHERLAELEPYKHLVGSGLSLGGAICTLHNVVSNSYSNEFTYPLSFFDGRSALHPMRSCITFGSPKVGNESFALYCPWGTNVCRANDPVPMLPISLGYARQPIKRLLPEGKEAEAGITKWLLPFIRKRRLVAFRDHLMEGYVQMCASRTNTNIE